MPTTNSTQENGLTVVPYCPKCELLLSKIEEQTALLQHNLKEINNTLKLPKLEKNGIEAISSLNNE